MVDSKPGLYVIGIDGATFDLIKPWAAAGKLPTFAHMLDNGAHGILHSPVPQSPPAWASLMTGKNPGKHGIYDFTQPKPGSYDIELASGATCKAESIWSLLTRRSRSVGVVNVPMTFPPAETNGFVISGFDTPYGNKEFAQPKHLVDKLQSLVGDYTFFPLIAGVPLNGVVENFHQTIEERSQVMEYLLSRYTPDFFMLVFNATDTIQHLCLQSDKEMDDLSPQMSGLLSIYQRLDKFLSDLIKRLPSGASLMVVSDHGGGPLHSYVHLDHWLATNGWLAYASDSIEAGARRQRTLRLARGLRLTKSLIPSFLKSRLRRIKSFKLAFDRAVKVPRLEWAQTYAFTYGSQGIYINLQGRQPEGIVEPGPVFETLKSQITAKLMDLKDPDTNEAVVRRVFRKEELFHGPHLEAAPDLYIQWQEDAYLSWSDDSFPREKIFIRPTALGYEDVVPDATRSVSIGCHRPEGIILLYGNAARQGHIVSGAGIVDIAPTMLALMGESVPREMDGSVLKEALSDTHNERYEDVYMDPTEDGADTQSASSGYSEDEEAMVEKRLRELGYL